MPHSYRHNICAHCGSGFMARTDALLHGEGRYCSRSCARLSRPRADPIARFWSKVDKSTPDGCWLWTGDLNEKGYGFFVPAHGTKVYAHRYSYELANGPLPDGLQACHYCDNPPCVRGDHLFAGTQKQNIRDAVRKGRMAVGDQHGSRKAFLSRPRAAVVKPSNSKARGGDHGMAKLTADDVREIRRLSSTVTQSQIADRYGINRSAVSMIATRKRWSHI